MAFINSLLSWIMKKRMHQIELFLQYPHDVQFEWFRKLMNAARDTEWGKKYDYVSIARPEQFRERVPVSDYEALKPYIERLRKGEQNLLWPQEIRWFAKSSGTTSDKSKYIPVSEDALEECHFMGAKDVLTLYCNNNPGTRMFDGKGLTLGGSHQICELDTKAYYGDLSAILIQNAPFWAQFIRTPNLSIALMDEWESKIAQMASVTSRENVTSISGVPSWALLLLQHILRHTGKENIMEVWPNLELYFHGGVSFVPYREQFMQVIPSGNMRYMETYNASEGFFGIQDQPGSDELLLMLDYGVFYEFMPMDQLENAQPKTLLLHEVEEGVNYALIISTNAGLWRYLIGDTIRFTSTNPYRFKITGRTKSHINVFGEELMVDNADQAVAGACKKTGAVVTEYTAAPFFSNDRKSAAHEWIIEFAEAPENLEYFTEVLDNGLKSLNSDYEAKRYKGMILGTPLVQSVPPGTFYNWLKMRGKLGGQHKVPRLSNERKYVEELLSLQHTTQ
jgi:hypothetical protein